MLSFSLFSVLFDVAKAQAAVSAREKPGEMSLSCEELEYFENMIV